MTTKNHLFKTIKKMNFVFCFEYSLNIINVRLEVKGLN